MPEPLEHAIAERVPCALGHNECRDRAYRCEGCDGDGTRWVITDKRIEPVEHQCENDYYPATDEPCTPAVADYWKPVAP